MIHCSAPFLIFSTFFFLFYLLSPAFRVWGSIWGFLWVVKRQIKALLRFLFQEYFSVSSSEFKQLLYFHLKKKKNQINKVIK